MPRSKKAAPVPVRPRPRSSRRKRRNNRTSQQRQTSSQRQLNHRRRQRQLVRRAAVAVQQCQWDWWPRVSCSIWRRCRDTRSLIPIFQRMAKFSGECFFMNNGYKTLIIKFDLNRYKTAPSGAWRCADCCAGA